ncbi:MAG: hypothetical protein EB039_02990 [Proteobacteria bacterium]|nr:hypothetical protein [Pseudomonadota bacterium]
MPDRVDDREKLADTSNARVGHNLTQDAECSMALRFERGDPSRPSGHALLYFRTGSNDGHDVHVTYVVVLPVVVNPMKYLPPAFASQIAAFNFISNGVTSFVAKPTRIWAGLTARSFDLSQCSG